MQVSRCRVVKVVITLTGFVLPSVFVVLPALGRAGNPETQHTGFLSDYTWPAPKVYKVNLNSDDGTECAGIWYPHGVSMSLDCIGRDYTHDFTVGLRFAVPDLEQGDSVMYARLLLSAQGGLVSSQVKLSIRGCDEDSPATFSSSRLPSDLPKTDDSVAWCFNRVWETTGTGLHLYRPSPNLGCIINEILSRPGWGQGEEGKQVALVIEQADCEPGEANYLNFEDFSTEFEIRDQAVLEVYRSLAEAFLAKPMLGRVSDSSVVINMMSLLEVDVYAEYGTQSGTYDFSTAPLLNQPAEHPIEIMLPNLLPNTAYHYRMRYREAGNGDYLESFGGAFVTQRARQSAFVFAVQADAHPYLLSGTMNPRVDWRLYEQTLANLSACDPDFLIDMGDFADIEGGGYVRSILSLGDAENRYLEQREYIDKITHSIPFYLVLGNHEGEQGWRRVNEDDSIEVWGTIARKSLIPNPVPDGFYVGNQDYTECCGLREDYYAWEWGDALFVVIDPFWYTTKVPHWYTEYPRQGDGWEWTLGQEQYEWFFETLHSSNATWKFVFAHHEAGGVLTGNSYYGRGGIESAKYKVDTRPSFEWGGEDAAGNDVFAVKRPGWEHGSIHDIMVAEGVTIFFHGHDHVYVHQTLDGVVYQACPRPKDSEYSDGFWDAGHYASGTKFNNSGHLKVSVSQEAVEVAYVRSVLPEHEPLLEDTVLVFNNDISHTYTIELSGVVSPHTGPEPPHLLAARPNPFSASTVFEVFMADSRWARVTIHDVNGNLLRVLFDGPVGPGFYRLRWDGRTTDGNLSPGIYFCRLVSGGCVQTTKVLLVR